MSTNDSKINQLFNNLDTWRHLPNYQLERRADIFFSLYLAEVLKTQKTLGLDGELLIIPEFPCHHKTVRGKRTNHSFKIDYLVACMDGKSACLVELKTDNSSIDADQITNMEDAKKAGLVKLTNGVDELCEASSVKGKVKYKQLINQTNGMKDWKIEPTLSNVFIIPKAPNENKLKELGGATIITFDEYATVVEKHSDFISLRFAKSLREWAKDDAGSPK